MGSVIAICYDSYCLFLKDQIKSNLSLYSLYYAEACNELAGPISASLRPGNTAPFEEMSQRWRAVGNTVSDLTGLRFEPQTSRSRDERVTARPTGRCPMNLWLFWKHFCLSCLCSSLNENKSCYNKPSLKCCSQHIFVNNTEPSIH